MLGSIWAQNAAGVIGAGGKIPWRYSGDFKRFKRVTMGAAIIIGRKTWESIGKPLPGRLNIVISSTPVEVEGVVWLGRHSGLHVFDVARHVAAERGHTDVWFIGGRQIYEAAMPFVDMIDVTLVPDDVPTEGAVLAPEIDRGVFEPEPGPGTVSRAELIAGYVRDYTAEQLARMHLDAIDSAAWWQSQCAEARAELRKHETSKDSGERAKVKHGSHPEKSPTHHTPLPAAGSPSEQTGFSVGWGCKGRRLLGIARGHLEPDSDAFRETALPHACPELAETLTERDSARAELAAIRNELAPGWEEYSPESYQAYKSDVLRERQRADVAEARLQRLQKAVVAYIEYWSLEHEDDCPMDDTCRCPLVRAVEKALHRPECAIALGGRCCDQNCAQGLVAGAIRAMGGRR